MVAWFRAWIRDYFGFSKTEANGVLVLMLLCCIFIIAPRGLKWYHGRKSLTICNKDFSILEATLNVLKQQKQSSHTSLTESKSFSQVQLFNINTADEAQLRTIKGIGDVLSKRIIKFRNKLGGFVSQMQYQEVYGLSPAVIHRLQKHTYISTDFHACPLNINTADIQVLAAHPYLTYQQAKSIVRYREQNGPFTHVDVLESLSLLDRETLKKVHPYLITN